jgi:hypothetical protein
MESGENDLTSELYMICKKEELGKNEARVDGREEKRVKRKIGGVLLNFN